METAPNVFIPRIFNDHSWKGTRALKTEEEVVILTLIFCTVAADLFMFCECVFFADSPAVFLCVFVCLRFI
jgi:hypothetical protein